MTASISLDNGMSVSCGKRRPQVVQSEAPLFGGLLIELRGSEIQEEFIARGEQEE
jgi:hypothetical protein